MNLFSDLVHIRSEHKLSRRFGLNYFIVLVLLYLSSSITNTKLTSTKASQELETESVSWLSGQTYKVFREEEYYKNVVDSSRSLDLKALNTNYLDLDKRIYSHPKYNSDFSHGENNHRGRESARVNGPVRTSGKNRKRREDSIRSYTKHCNHTIDMWPEKLVKIVTPFWGTEQYPAGFDCEWELIGADICIPQITCKTLDLRSTEDCRDEYLRISDGVTSEKIFCGSNQSFSTPLTGRQGFYMYLTLETGGSTYFDRLYKGIDCTIFCHIGTRPRKTAMELPAAEIIKEEYTCLCGRQSNDRNRIVGGIAAKKKELPWQVALVKAGTRQPFCGGSLINNQYILTAAHCMDKIKKTTSLEVLLHAHVLEQNVEDENKMKLVEIKLGQTGSPKNQETPTDAQENTIRLAVDKIMSHRHYNRFADSDNDIALLRLKTKLNLKDRDTDSAVTPICLPAPEDQFRNLKDTMALVSGWGYSHENAGVSTKILQKLQVPILEKSVCDNLYKEIGLSEYVLCAGYSEGGKDACQGDSGGPLTIKEGGAHVQIGIVSFGAGCGRKDKPGIYTAVAHYIPWIRQKTRGALWCRRNS